VLHVLVSMLKLQEIFEEHERCFVGTYMPVIFFFGVVEDNNMSKAKIKYSLVGRYLLVKKFSQLSLKPINAESSNLIKVLGEHR